MEFDDIESYLLSRRDSERQRSYSSFSFEQPHSCYLCENIYVELDTANSIACCKKCRKPPDRGFWLPFGGGCQYQDPLERTTEIQPWPSLAVKMDYCLHSITK